MCYTDVTKWRLSSLTFVEKGNMLKFQDVRHHKPGNKGYVFVTFAGDLNRHGVQEKREEIP